MKREYWIILIVYIGMQFSSLVGVPLLMLVLPTIGIDKQQAVPVWLLISFLAALLITLFILRKEMKSQRAIGSSWGQSVQWAFLGFFLALFSQYAAAIVESMLGVQSGSENTQQILHLIDTFPLAIIVTSIFGPILEEVVFRKIIFGSLYRRYNFFISGLISSVIFALAHMEPEHIILYSAMGFTFAFLYVKTKRIIVPMFAHVAMNTMVVLVQSVFRDDIERLLKQAEAVQNFIGGFL
ncbi:CPBP family intramembrane glutamic endopeptidase [Neobacillus dielmonensis]|uniref:CPBP family intramembrane glutamic endopeptidase n=1 Tax=Neobacillus dielmonensis TaxID=1347369 RepID=UPI0005A7122C|nr:type II CAAX endopeptidase family protein [Neobacillus dielmonensis]